MNGTSEITPQTTEVASDPLCPGCLQPMHELTSRTRGQLMADGYGCYDCEFWDIYFAGGAAPIASEADFPKGRPLGKPVHAYEVLNGG